MTRSPIELSWTAKKSAIHLVVHTTPHPPTPPPSSPSDEIYLPSPPSLFFISVFRLLQIVFQNVFKMFFFVAQLQTPFSKDIFSDGIGLELDIQKTFQK